MEVVLFQVELRKILSPCIDFEEYLGIAPERFCDKGRFSDG
jgi:hypothetical protein